MASTSHSGVNYGAQVGINYGTSRADFHLPPERPETPPSPLSTVPFARDPDFVSRDTLLNQEQPVLWVHTSNATRFEQSFRDHEFLRKSPVTSHGDPKNSLVNVSTKPLLEYLRRSLDGFVIIISRTREAVLKMVDYKDLIDVEPMDRSEALKLLQRKLEQQGGKSRNSTFSGRARIYPASDYAGSKLY
ncbi:ABC transporter sequence [Penicillium atrosanguineum]|uniref:ABC transporter sequence n=1 Tax=Penicillium atrosanguineum TaxID=1132637 RepID=UPI0023914840|nr:ABC transporter sequence [Penicillium atrosanguineum]KAJ5313232.1 ABC transporter sequence [Penicillium atrosanguineum]